jgi:RNA polymerase subunit RPABC4/transcription elongation factor Spt4
VMIGAVQANPALTTVGGTFGNPDLGPRRPGTERPPEPSRPALGFNPRTPVDCRYCRTVIPYDLAFCPRCARPRECRGCGRVLGVAGDRTDCPGCHRVEAFCNCPHLPRSPGASTTSARGPRRV